MKIRKDKEKEKVGENLENTNQEKLGKEIKKLFPSFLS